MDSSSRGSGSETGERSGLGHWPIALAMAWCLTALIPAPVAEWGDWRDWAWPLRATPPKALAVGIGLALGGLVSAGASEGWGKKSSRLLMQWSIVLSGLTMSVTEVLRAGATGVAFTAATIAGSFVLGWALWRLLGTDGKVTTLLSSGTAICGGSAIAAVSPVIGASAAQISVAMATVFVLNGVGLYAFPAIGSWLGMTGQEFGTWAGIAIHDTSSVYGAGQVFDAGQAGSDSLQQAMAVKLSRTLWILPIVVGAAWWVRRAAGREARAGSSSFPWFVVWFMLACAAGSVSGWFGGHRSEIRLAAGAGMTMALLLIGSGLTVGALKTVGLRPLAQGVLQWIALSVAALAAVRWSW